MLRFATAVKLRYIIASGLPSEDYPPANIASMIKQCEALGRDDLADQIKMQWRKVLNKYPNTRLNWPTAVAIGGNSIKKNIFGGKEFVMWLKDQEDLTAEQKAVAQKVETILPPPKGTPAIAVPKKDETPEQWQEEAAKTKEAYIAAKKAFGDVKEYISYLEKEAADLKKKIKTYGAGGEKEKTKSGEPSKYAGRVPKWEELLKVAIDMIEETKKNLKEVESDFKGAVTNYNNAPITTVAYEKKAQSGLENVLEYVLNMKDLDKQRDLLEKLNAAMGTKTTAGVEEVVAADKIASLMQKIKDGLKAVMAWIKGLRASVNEFGKLAALRY
jgi:phage host-nuclease inhibitor protein Gam